MTPGTFQPCSRGLYVATGQPTPRRVQCCEVLGLPVVDRFTEQDGLAVSVDEQRATELGRIGLQVSRFIGASARQCS